MHLKLVNGITDRLTLWAKRISTKRSFNLSPSVAKFNTLEVTSQGNSESENDLIVIGIKLAVLTDSSSTNETLQKTFSHFQILLLLSYCGLLEKRGVSYKTVDQITQRVSCF